MDDGYCVRESLEVDTCGHSVAFRDLTCDDRDFLSDLIYAFSLSVSITSSYAFSVS